MRRETSTDYAHPHRPRPLRVANRALGLFERTLGVRPSLAPHDLLEAARRGTGLSDFGDPAFREPLAKLIDSIEDEARLHPLGRFITRTRIVSALKTRLLLTELLKRRPEIEDRRIVRPIVIVGLPRTGTTFLHRLLATDVDRIRALRSWEALMPVPRSLDGAAKGRIDAAVRSESALAYMAPDFFAVHPIDARGPEEEILLLDLSFRSTVAEATMRVPSFAAWLETVDQSPAYRFMASALKALEWQRAPAYRGFRWVLKTPHHLEWLEELPKVFERPVIVWTHRAPNEVVASFCSMIAHGRGVFSDQVDPHEIGRFWLRKGKRMVDRAMARRGSIDADVIDVKYEDLLRDPVGTALMIEERAGLPLDPRARARMLEGKRREVKDRHGVHRYALQYFGLTEADVARAFSDYRAALGFP